jgi:hypothetical protein
MDLLEQILAEVMAKPARRRAKPAEQPIYFDADRFRWWFRHGCQNLDLLAMYNQGIAARWTLDQWRIFFDGAMNGKAPEYNPF